MSAASLPAGVYAGQVVVTIYTGNANYAMAVPVNLTVENSATAFFGGMVGGLNFVYGNGFTAPAQNISIVRGGSGVLNWTASSSIFLTSSVSSVNWLNLSASSGRPPALSR